MMLQIWIRYHSTRLMLCPLLPSQDAPADLREALRVGGGGGGGWGLETSQDSSRSGADQSSDLDLNLDLSLSPEALSLSSAPPPPPGSPLPSPPSSPPPFPPPPTLADDDVVDRLRYRRLVSRALIAVSEDAEWLAASSQASGLRG